MLMLSHVDMLSFEISTQANSSVNDGHCFLMFDIQLLPAIRSNDQTLRRLQQNLTQIVIESSQLEQNILKINIV